MQLSVISRPVIGGVLSLCKDLVDVFNKDEEIGQKESMYDIKNTSILGIKAESRLEVPTIKIWLNKKKVFEKNL